MSTQGYPPVSIAFQPTPAAMRALAVALNHILQGRQNVIKNVRLLNGAFSTTITDPRLSGVTALYFGALTANAAILAPTIWYDTKANGSVVVHHGNTARTDQNYDLLIIG